MIRTKAGIFIALMLACASVGAHDMGYGHVYKTEPSNAANKDKAVNYKVPVSCYGLHRGKTYACTITSELHGIKDSEGYGMFKIENMLSPWILDLKTRCSNRADVDVENLFYYGGHLHDQAARHRTKDGSDYLLGDSPSDSVNEPFINVNPYIVRGYTNNTCVNNSCNYGKSLIYKTPEKAGIFTSFTTMVVPEPISTRFVWRFDDGNDHQHHLVKNLSMISGLTRIEGCTNAGFVDGQNYKLVRGTTDTTNHPEAHWAKLETIKVAKELADTIAKTWDEKIISFNDFSYPLGGFSKWHQSHRAGKDFDMNQSGMDDYNCNSENDADLWLDGQFAALWGTDSLIKGVAETAGEPTPNLHCYPEDYKPNPNGLHVNVN